MAAMMAKSKVFPMHMLAGILLAAMAGLYVLAWRLHLPALRAFAEAALVGGIADWFAVTALFRRPLGLPIPHTALVPANQARLGRALGDFVQHNFLAPELVAARLRRHSPAAWLADRLAEPAVVDALARRLAKVAADDDIRHALAALLRPGPPLAHGVEMALRQHWHHRAFDLALDAVAAALARDDGFILGKVADRSGRWVPAWVDRKLADNLTAALAAALDDLRHTDHPWRQAAAAWAERLAGRLRDDPALADHLSRWRDVVLAELVAEPRLAPLLAQALTGWGRKLAADPVARARLDRRLIRLAERLVVPSRQEIGRFIADVVQHWDGATLVAKLESQVGRDLQFIRINGTIVGGLVGLALYGLSHLSG